MTPTLGEYVPEPLPDPEEIERAPKPTDENDDEARRSRAERGPRPGKALRLE
jgi:hypothetical protein